MLDGGCAFEAVPAQDFDIYWGAYLGMAEEIAISGPLAEVGGAHRGGAGGGARRARLDHGRLSAQAALSAAFRRAHSAFGPGRPRRSQRSGPGEGARPDARPGQPFAGGGGVAGVVEAEERGAAGEPPARGLRQPVEAGGAGARGGRAWRRPRPRSASASRPASSAGPLTGQGPAASARRAISDAAPEREAEAEPGEAEELAERAQRDEARAARVAGRAETLRLDVGEALVDDEQPDRIGEREQRLRRQPAAVGIVGVDDDGRVEAAQAGERRRPRCTDQPAPAKAAACSL